jgi:serine/threonine protein kinase
VKHLFFHIPIFPAQSLLQNHKFILFSPQKYSPRGARRSSMELVVGGHFLVRQKLGSGSFGEIYLAFDTQSRREIALKLEPARTRSPQLAFEYRIYRELEHGVGIVPIIWFGQEAKYTIIAMDLLGESLEDILVRMKGSFSLKTVLMIVEQTL